MPTYKPYTKRHLDMALKEIEAAIYTVVGKLDIRAWCTRRADPFRPAADGRGEDARGRRHVGRAVRLRLVPLHGRCARSGRGPEGGAAARRQRRDVRLRRDGVPVRGLTNVASTFDYPLGRPGKRVLPFADHARGGEPIDVWADAGCNDLFGNLQEDGTIKEAAIAICNEAVRGLFYDYRGAARLPEGAAGGLAALPADPDRADRRGPPALRRHRGERGRRRVPSWRRCWHSAAAIPACASARSATRTWIWAGCGRSARRSARARAPSPRPSPTWRNIPTTSSAPASRSTSSG